MFRIYLAVFFLRAPKTLVRGVLKLWHSVTQFYIPCEPRQARIDYFTRNLSNFPVLQDFPNLLNQWKRIYLYVTSTQRIWSFDTLDCETIQLCASYKDFTFLTKYLIKLEIATPQYLQCSEEGSQSQYHHKHHDSTTRHHLARSFSQLLNHND